jgi:hypothetical protein
VRDIWHKAHSRQPERGGSAFSGQAATASTDSPFGDTQPEEAGPPRRLTDSLLNHAPAYTTSAGWLGYSDAQPLQLCREGVAGGWTHFKQKVGRDLQDDIRRASIIRSEIGPDRKLMMDANQVWDVGQAIAWMRELEQFDPWWIEEPTSPDDVLSRAAIARALEPIRVATGEHCQNRVMFKQLLQANAIGVCQVDAARLGGVNEVLAVLLVAAKFGVPVCPHAGGVGLCEYVQHLSMVDYVRVSATMDDRVIEYGDHLHEHFVDQWWSAMGATWRRSRQGTAPRCCQLRCCPLFPQGSLAFRGGLTSSPSEIVSEAPLCRAPNLGRVLNSIRGTRLSGAYPTHGRGPEMLWRRNSRGPPVHGFGNNAHSRPAAAPGCPRCRCALYEARTCLNSGQTRGCFPRFICRTQTHMKDGPYF